MMPAMKRIAILGFGALLLGGCDSVFVDPAYRASGPGDHRSAFEVMLAMAEAGSTGAGFVLASMYEGGRGTARDDAEAARWFLTAAESGDKDAQFALGLMYRDGRCVARDAAEAEKWLRRAAAIDDGPRM